MAKLPNEIFGVFHDGFNVDTAPKGKLMAFAKQEDAETHMRAAASMIKPPPGAPTPVYHIVRYVKVD